MRKFLAVAMAATMSTALAGCQTATDPLTGRPQVSNTAAGAGIGALTGAVAGLLIAGDGSGGEQRKAALIGAGVGALVGGSVGGYMDKQEQELRDQLRSSGVSVVRSGDQIILNLPSNVTFASDQDRLNTGFLPVLDSVAIVLSKYPRTLLDIDGHTDDQGSDQYNQALSERRAVSVAQYLTTRGVDSRRLLVAGFGETRPVADNSTDFGRQQNRRVEVRISPLT